MVDNTFARYYIALQKLSYIHLMLSEIVTVKGETILNYKV